MATHKVSRAGKGSKGGGKGLQEATDIGGKKGNAVDKSLVIKREIMANHSRTFGSPGKNHQGISLFWIMKSNQKEAEVRIATMV